MRSNIQISALCGLYGFPIRYSVHVEVRITLEILDPIDPVRLAPHNQVCYGPQNLQGALFLCVSHILVRSGHENNFQHICQPRSGRHPLLGAFFKDLRHPQISSEIS